MSPEQVVEYLHRVLAEEGVSYEEPALWLLGRAAAGSMRDALSLTDQAIAFGSGRLEEGDVRSMLGSVELGQVYELLEAVATDDHAGVLAAVARMAEYAPDFEGMLDELLSLLHRVATAQVVPDAIDNSWGDAERVAHLAGEITAEDAQLFYQIALTGKRDIALAPDPRRGFEMILLRMMAVRPAAVIDENLRAEALGAAQSHREGAGEAGAPVKKSVEPPDLNPERSRRASTHYPDGPGSFNLADLEPESWCRLLALLGLRGMIFNIASHCELRRREGSDLEFVLDEAHSTLLNDLSRRGRCGAKRPLGARRGWGNRGRRKR